MYSDVVSVSRVLVRKLDCVRRLEDRALEAMALMRFCCRAIREMSELSPTP